MYYVLERLYCQDVDDCLIDHSSMATFSPVFETEGLREK